ncbi:MAG: redox-sensitive transcriptional activator SoxR [Gammaproteobacteria bacterium]|nr:redox-sensitive transcriptional activator SoxR [Gammaproteobacteria bacterium]
MSKWRVGEVAKRAGVNVSTLHFYEQQGLIQSVRNASNHRYYHSDVLRRVGIIKAAQRLGIALDEIKAVFDELPNSRTPSTRDWQKISKQWRSQLAQRIQALQQLKDELDGCIGCGCLSLKKCKLRNPDDQLALEGPGARRLNLAIESSNRRK